MGEEQYTGVVIKLTTDTAHVRVDSQRVDQIPIVTLSHEDQKRIHIGSLIRVTLRRAKDGDTGELEILLLEATNPSYILGRGDNPNFRESLDGNDVHDDEKTPSIRLPRLPPKKKA